MYMGIIENHILKLTENCLELWILDQFKTVMSKVGLAVKKNPCLEPFKADIHCLPLSILAYCILHLFWNNLESIFKHDHRSPPQVLNQKVLDRARGFVLPNKSTRASLLALTP